MAETPVAREMPVLPLARTAAAPDLRERAATAVGWPARTPLGQRTATSVAMPGAAAGGVRAVLRFEGGAMLALAIAAYAQTGAGWLPFAVLFLAPDLSLLGYLAGPRIGALLYNAAHSTLGPLAVIGVGVGGGALGELGSLAAQPATLAAGLVWLAHVGFDRLCGFGLKYDGGFARTHLGQIGRPDPW